MSDDCNKCKNASYYSAALNAWFQTRIEHDRQLAGVSSLALGLLVTFRDDLTSIASFLIWLLTGLCFLACILITLITFWQNSNYIEAIISNKMERKESLDKDLSLMSSLAKSAFIFGIILMLLLAVSTVNFSTLVLNKQHEVAMTEKKKEQQETEQRNYGGYGKLSPPPPKPTKDADKTEKKD